MHATRYSELEASNLFAACHKLLSRWRGICSDTPQGYLIFFTDFGTSVQFSFSAISAI